MNGRRPLAELLGELAEAAAFAGIGAVRARAMSISLPIDLRLVPTPAGPVVIGDVPLFRTRTAFDPDPARLAVLWQSVPTEGTSRP